MVNVLLLLLIDGLLLSIVSDSRTSPLPGSQMGTW